MNWFQALLLQGEQPAPAAEPANPLFAYLPLFLMVLLLFQFIVARPGRRDQKKREEMLKQLKKNDPVATIGGILGTVANISDDGTEVTIKVDDTTRLRVRRSAISEVIAKTAPADATPAK